MTRGHMQNQQLVRRPLLFKTVHPAPSPQL